MEPTNIADQQQQSAASLPRLTAAEDSELRQLTWFAQVGCLSEKSGARLAELRARDRRDQVRDPRPDPSSKQLPPAGARLRSEPVASVPCSRCGFSLSGSGSPSSCPFCASHLAP